MKKIVLLAMARLVLAAMVIVLVASNASSATKVVTQGEDESGYKRTLRTDTKGRAQGVQAQLLLDGCDATTGWTALSTDTTGLAVALDHVQGTKSLEFDKVDSAANTIFGGIQTTLAASVDIAQYMENNGFILVSMNLSALTDVAYCFVRLGTDLSNYNEWRVDDDALSTGWNQVRYAFFTPDTAGNLGNGLLASAVAYVAVGCAFDLETSTLADIRVDNIAVNSGLQISADIQSQVGTGVSGASVVAKVQDGNSATLQDVLDAFADNLAYTLNGAMVGAVVLLDDGATLDMGKSGPTGGALVEVVNHPSAFNQSAGNADVDINDHTPVEPNVQGPTAVDSTKDGTVGDIIFTSRKILGDATWCVHIDNTGGGSGDTLSDAIVLVSPTGVAGTWESLSWTNCDTLASGGGSCSFCSDLAFTYVQVEALCDATEDTEVYAWYRARK